MKASDTLDSAVLKVLNQHPRERHVIWADSLSPSVRNAFAEGTPEKVMLAKMRKLVLRGLVDGCACGCRGDFKITPKGAEALEQSEHHHA